MPGERVLICGAGVAGSILAYWLGKHDYQVVVAERSKAEQKAGQGIEIEEPALKVVKAMGILDQLKAVKTGETGFVLQDTQSRSWGAIKMGRLSPTGELELMRGDLTGVLYKAADKSPNVTYHFETTFRTLSQTRDKVTVELEHRNTKTATTEEFDFVIGADGAKSRVRQLVIGPPEKLNYLKPIGVTVAYFSIPKQDGDWPYSKLCHFTKRRIVWLRPATKNSTSTSVYLIYAHDDIPALRQAIADGNRFKQKEEFAKLYAGLGWETPRVIEQMMKADNFYADDLTQVKLPQWHAGRVTLLGDAAWAPTPLTGEGNQLAIIGAWVLAQEMVKDRTPKAFENYDKRLRAHVANSQNIPLGGYAPYIFNPETQAAIWLFRIIFYFVALLVQFLSWSNITSLLPTGKEEDEFDMQMDAVDMKQ